MIQFLNQVGGLIGIVGVIFSIYSYKKTSIGGRLVYQTSTMSIVGQKNSEVRDIDIYYKGNQVPRIVRTNMIIWNNGYKEIEGNRIALTDYLRVEVNEKEEIIDIYVKGCTREVNEFNVKKDINYKNKAMLNFDYLDPKDGVFLEILHTDINFTPKILGSIKGLPNGVDYLGNIGVIQMLNVKNKNKGRKRLGYFMLLIGILMMLLFSILPIYIPGLENTFYSQDYTIHPYKTIFFTLSLLYIVLSGWVLFTQRRKYPKKLENNMRFFQFVNNE